MRKKGFKRTLYFMLLPGLIAVALFRMKPEDKYVRVCG